VVHAALDLWAAQRLEVELARIARDPAPNPWRPPAFEPHAEEAARLIASCVSGPDGGELLNLYELSECVADVAPAAAKTIKLLEADRAHHEWFREFATGGNGFPAAAVVSSAAAVVEANRAALTVLARAAGLTGQHLPRDYAVSRWMDQAVVLLLADGRLGAHAGDNVRAVARIDQALALGALLPTDASLIDLSRAAARVEQALELLRSLIAGLARDCASRDALAGIQQRIAASDLYARLHAALVLERGEFVRGAEYLALTCNFGFKGKTVNAPLLGPLMRWDIANVLGELTAITEASHHPPHRLLETYHETVRGIGWLRFGGQVDLRICYDDIASVIRSRACGVAAVVAIEYALRGLRAAEAKLKDCRDPYTGNELRISSFNGRLSVSVYANDQRETRDDGWWIEWDLDPWPRGSE
jgi:hypothetical protein